MQSPGAVAFEDWEIELINEAQAILLTGWTHEEYEAQPVALVDALLQVKNANDELAVWRNRRGKR